MSAPPVVPFVITDHAKGVMARRGITFDVVAAVLTAPAQRYTVRPGRDVVQALIEAGNPAVRYVVRIWRGPT
jgi:hypothetical protein